MLLKVYDFFGVPNLLSYGGPELFVALVIIVVTPVLWGIVLRHFRLSVNLIAIGILWSSAIVVAYRDVYQITKEAERLCREEAGLHVYKTVEAEGFLGAGGIEFWSQYGFRYLEMEFAGGRKMRYTLQSGEVHKERVEEFQSRYEFVTDEEVLEMPIVRLRQMIKDRQTGEILGDVVAYLVYPGWIDSRIIGFLGFSWSPRKCYGDHIPTRDIRINPSDLIKAVIKGKESKAGE